MPEVAFPGDELAPHERKAVASLVLEGWTYMYCDGEDFVMQSPEQIGTKDCWRIDRDGKAPAVYVRGERPVPPPTPMKDLLAKLTTLTPPTHAKGVDPECKDRAPGFTLAQVRSLVRQGYSGAQVQLMTGWGGYWFADMLDTDGYYNEERETA